MLERRADDPRAPVGAKRHSGIQHHARRRGHLSLADRSDSADRRFRQSRGARWDGLWNALSAPRVLQSLKLTFGAALIAGSANAVFGLLVVWVFVRYEFPGMRIFDAMIDLPFALPTAVAGIALTALYSANGWIGQFLEPLGIKVAYTVLGIIIAMTFIRLPFVVRTVEPVAHDAEMELEEAATPCRKSLANGVASHPRNR